jgi:hypothetical protein
MDDGLSITARVSAKLKTDNEGYVVEVFYEVRNKSDNDVIAGVRINVLYANDNDAKISDAIAAGRERAHRILLHLSQLEQSALLPVDPSLSFL